MVVAGGVGRCRQSQLAMGHGLDRMRYAPSRRYTLVSLLCIRATVRLGGVKLIYFGLDLTKLVVHSVHRSLLGLSGTGRKSFWTYKLAKLSATDSQAVASQ